MILSSIKLTHFRNFDEATFEFHPHLTIIIGENARGKTNLLESVYFSIHGEGFRESKEEELLNWGKSKSLVESVWKEKDSQNLFQIFLTVANGVVTKKFYVDKAVKSHQQYDIYQKRAVLFAPEHIDIISGSPDKRREYFNKLISSLDQSYKNKLINYEQALRRRNKLLEHTHSIETLKEELVFWNDYMYQQAVYITQKRQEYVDYLNTNKEVDHRQFEIEYKKNEFTQERLSQVFDEERKWHRTVIGPQKDDFMISLIENTVKENVHMYGSRSEQRLAVFWLKLNEIRYYESELKSQPILLLDDVFSELDVKNKKLVADLVKKYQTILTTTEVEMINIIGKDKSIITI